MYKTMNKKHTNSQIYEKYYIQKSYILFDSLMTKNIVNETEYILNS